MLVCRECVCCPVSFVSFYSNPHRAELCMKCELLCVISVLGMCKSVHACVCVCAGVGGGVGLCFLGVLFFVCVCVCVCVFMSHWRSDRTRSKRRGGSSN